MLIYLLDLICKLFRVQPLTELIDRLEEAQDELRSLKRRYKRDARTSPVKKVLKLDDKPSDIIFIQLKEDENPQEFKDYLEKKYISKVKHEPQALIIVATHLDDIKKLDQVDIEEHISKFKLED